MEEKVNPTPEHPEQNTFFVELIARLLADIQRESPNASPQEIEMELTQRLEALKAELENPTSLAHFISHLNEDTKH